MENKIKALVDDYLKFSCDVDQHVVLDCFSTKEELLEAVESCIRNRDVQHMIDWLNDFEGCDCYERASELASRFEEYNGVRKGFLLELTNTELYFLETLRINKTRDIGKTFFDFVANVKGLEIESVGINTIDLCIEGLLNLTDSVTIEYKPNGFVSIEKQRYKSTLSMTRKEFEEICKEVK